MKIADLKPGVYRDGYHFHVIDDVTIRTAGELDAEERAKKESNHRSYWHYNKPTKLVQTQPCGIQFDSEGNAGFGNIYGDNNITRWQLPNRSWIVPATLREYLGTVEEYLAMRTEAEKSARRTQAVIDQRWERMDAALERLKDQYELPGFEAGKYRRSQPLATVDYETVLALVELLDSQSDEVSHMHEVHD